MVVQERERPALSLNGEVVFSKELTLRELLGLKENGFNKRLGLNDVPFVFEVRDLGYSFLHIASFSQKYPLDSENFLYLLSAAKSGGRSRGGQVPYGIIDDWDIILPWVRERNPRKKDLYVHHKKNVPNFSEFEENHFKKFWDAIKARSSYEIQREEDRRGIRRPVIKERQRSPNPLSYPSYLSPLVIWQRHKETNKASYFCGQIPKKLIQLHPYLFSERHDTLLGQLTVAAYSPEARDQMPTEITMMGTDGVRVTQELLEAQSVLLVPNNAELFLEQSPVILDLEKMAKK